MMSPIEKQTAQEFAAELKEDVFAIEMQRKNIGKQRTMNIRQKGEVADHFGAKHRSVGGNKKLFAPNCKEVKRITSLMSDAYAVWQDMTISYRRGARLMRKDHLPTFIEKFDEIEEELKEAIAEADANYDEILKASKEFLGDQLFDIGDYPKSFAGLVDISWSVYNFKPSEELLRLAPETFAREQKRVQQKFEEAVLAYEEEARYQLSDLVESLLAKLADKADGKKVKFSESATNNLRDFFKRFETLGIYSDEELTELTKTAQAALGGTTMADLKKSNRKSRNIAESFSAVKTKLDSLIIDAPSRSINLDDLDD